MRIDLLTLRRSERRLVGEGGCVHVRTGGGRGPAGGGRPRWQGRGRASVVGAGLRRADEAVTPHGRAAPAAAAPRRGRATVWPLFGWMPSPALWTRGPWSAWRARPRVVGPRRDASTPFCWGGSLVEVLQACTDSWSDCSIRVVAA